MRRTATTFSLEIISHRATWENGSTDTKNIFSHTAPDLRCATLSSSSNRRETEVKCFVLAMRIHRQGLTTARTLRWPRSYYRTDLRLCGNSSSDVMNMRRWRHKTSYTSAALHWMLDRRVLYFMPTLISMSFIYLMRPNPKKGALCPLPSSAHGSVTAGGTLPTLDSHLAAI